MSHPIKIDAARDNFPKFESGPPVRRLHMTLLTSTKRWSRLFHESFLLLDTSWMRTKRDKYGHCHPGVLRMLHFVRSENLPYSTTVVRRIVSSCKICAERKPRLYRLQEGSLIKAMRLKEE